VQQKCFVSWWRHWSIVLTLPFRDCFEAGSRSAVSTLLPVPYTVYSPFDHMIYFFQIRMSLLAKSRLSSQESGEQCPYQPSSPHTFRGTAETTTTFLYSVKEVFRWLHYKQQISADRKVMPKVMNSIASMGDMVAFGIGLSYRPPRLCSLAGHYEPALQPYAGVNFIPPVRVYEFGC